MMIPRHTTTNHSKGWQRTTDGYIYTKLNASFASSSSHSSSSRVRRACTTTFVEEPGIVLSIMSLIPTAWRLSGLTNPCRGPGGPGRELTAPGPRGGGRPGGALAEVL